MFVLKMRRLLGLRRDDDGEHTSELTMDNFLRVLGWKIQDYPFAGMLFEAEKKS